jgi:beta-ureidopropionase / N-carbamoyl-L-amino-acid hydrolase
MAPKIDPERLLGDLKTLRSFGACGTGVVRQAFSDIDMAARRWLAQRMSEAGLEPRIDGVGNVVGRSPNAGRALVMGSHTDTQPRGGWLDGALGVIYALEVARALAEDRASAHLPLDIGSWMDEEGSYLGCLGSASFTATLSDEKIRAATNRDGRTVADALAAAGLAGEAPTRLDPERHCAYLEAHIEQGPVLEAEGKRIGVVTSIVGVRTFILTFSGQQNHAGTTPMKLRRDAGDALIVLAARLREAMRALLAERTVFTIGRIALDPGADSIIAGRAEMSLQIRDADEAQLDRMAAAVRRLVAEANEAGPVKVDLAESANGLKGALMDEGLQDHLAAAAERHAPGAWLRMPSGAAHDAQIFARRLPAAMLFVPSIGGISHDFAEDTAEADIVLGCQVLASAAAAILGDLNAS